MIPLEEAEAKMLTTDGSYEQQLLPNGDEKDPDNTKKGAWLLLCRPGNSLAGLSWMMLRMLRRIHQLSWSNLLGWGWNIPMGNIL